MPPSSVPDLALARAGVAGARVWVLSDGKAGDEVQCLGVAERLGLEPELRRVKPRAPYLWLMPWGGIDPAEAPGRPGSPLAGPLPDIAIASGRRTASYLRKVKALSGGRCFTVFLKDPRCGAGTADFLWVPEHDRLRGANVLATLTSPHRISPERLAAARTNPPYGLDRLPGPRVAVLIGGDSAHHRFTPGDIATLLAHCTRLAETGATLMATASRRTPPALAGALTELVRGSGGFFWDGTGENPYIALLALADAVVVTADSVNMAGEAAATGKPVLLFEPSGGSDKITRFLRQLERAGVVHRFDGTIAGSPYQPIDSTPAIAAELARRYLLHRRALS
ncbi:MAG TPA: mitochondrial fission ELM1 family protein [Beijerinckiaceae bacterium]|nr:mitochondrial fission ELM1 family protein [Beijerinckiaceae bacterium]